MNISRWLGTGLLSLGLCITSAVPAENEAPASPNVEHKFELAKKYYGECAATEAAEFENIRPYLKAFTDIDVMTDTLADPARMAQLMAIVSDPRTIHVMSKCATEPVMWDTWMRGVTDWQGMMRAMMKFTNPAIYMNWMMAPMNPATYQPMMQMMQPNWYGRWMTAMMNPTFYQPMFSMGRSELVHAENVLDDEPVFLPAHVQRHGLPGISRAARPDGTARPGTTGRIAGRRTAGPAPAALQGTRVRGSLQDSLPELCYYRCMPMPAISKRAHG